MLVTIISLLLIILLVLLLHHYARWFLFQSRRRTSTTTTTTDSQFPFTTRRALPSFILASLPLFVHRLSSPSDSDNVLDCAICLSVFQEEEIGRKLPGCGHAFHVDCIDMWLHSHSTCPICRAAILLHYNYKMENANRIVDHVEINLIDQEQLAIDNVVQESPKSNTFTEIHSGPSCSSS